ncbi:hypothetical protein [Niastella sp. OAS944]|uniref:hypothetical protein n=1 Tax=Niastella sp. OAS944 TaxID=2664089 RepID=UPI0034995231|nr:hypothetical protein [Chitinophagaceae bacterium OAS944]
MMKYLQSYKINTEKRFSYHVSFVASVVALFSQSSIFDEAIDAIKKRNIRESFKTDAQQLRKDFDNTLSKTYRVFE